MHPVSQQLEYKSELTDTLEREVVCFLNSREGGRILIGLDDAGAILGLADPDGDTLTNIAEITLHCTNPLLADTDSDGLSDNAELNHPTSHFAVVLGNFTYRQSVADATAKRGRVASFPNSADIKRMANKACLTTQGYLWIGLSDATTEGTWLWTNGSTATYSLWLTGEPSGDTSENHVVIMENSNKWADTMETFTAVEFRFNAASGVSYRIEGSTELDEWNTVETDIIGAGAVVTRFYSIENIPCRYFRARRN